MYIGDYLRELLVQNNEVSIPGLGVFYLVRKNAYFNEQEGKFYPPYHELQFKPKPKDDDVFISYLADKKNLQKATAIFIIEKQVNDLLEKARYAQTELPYIGWFSFENEQLIFKPNNDSVIDSSLFGFTPISLTPSIKEEEEVFIEEGALNLPAEPAIEHHPLENYLTVQPEQIINQDVYANTENSIEPNGHVIFDQPIEDERVTTFQQHADTEHIIGEELASEPAYPSELIPPTEDERATPPLLHEESENIVGAEHAKAPEYPQLQEAPIEDERIDEVHAHDESEHFGDEELAIKTTEVEHIPTKVEEPKYFEPDISTEEGKSEIVWSFNDEKDEVINFIPFEPNQKEIIEEEEEQNTIITEPQEQLPIDELYNEDEYEEAPKRRLGAWAIFFIIFGIVTTGFAGLYFYIPSFAVNVNTTYKNILGVDTLDSTKIKATHNLIKRDTVIDTSNKKTVFVEGSQVKVIYFKIIDGKYLKLTQARAEVRRLEDRGVEAEILSNIPGIYLNVSVGSYQTYDKAYKEMKVLIDAGKINKNSKIIETFQK